MKDIFLVVSGVLTIVSAVPYIRDILRRTTKPRIVTWFNWSLLTGIATAAAIADNQWPSAVITGTATITTMSIALLGLRYGDTKIEPFDVVCQLAAILGLVLWVITNDPLIAIVITAVVDFIAALPTLRHSWLKPYEETSMAFVLGGIGGIFAVLALDNPSVSGLIYPFYIVCANLVLVYLIKFSPNQKPSKASHTL